MSATVESRVDPGEHAGRPHRRRRRLWRWSVRMALVLAAVLASYVAVTFVQVLSTSRQGGADSADAIVVLGAAQYDCRPSPVLAQRLEHARQLYDEGVAPTIVVTGGKRDGDRCTEAQAGADHLRAAGVSDDDLLLEVQGRSTWESLAAAARILRQRDLTDVVLVTDGYHGLRVQSIAEELGLNGSVSPSRPGGTIAEYVRETGAVALGRIVGFRRLVDLDARTGAAPDLDVRSSAAER